MRRKLSVLTVVAIFLVSVLGTGALAATEVEVVEALWEDATLSEFVEDFAVLGATGVYIGYPDGTARPFHPLTRAEFAVTAIRVMGKERVATAFEMTPPVFPDVPDSWMWGWVNAAQAYGVIAGYPDGTFRPNNDVNFAEASTMLLNVLGYEVEGPWPAAWIATAIDVGIICDDIYIIHPTTVPVLREDMARMVYNAMFNVFVAVDGEEPDEEDEETLFEYEEGTVTSVTASTIRIAGKTYDLASKVALYGADELADLVDADVEFLLDKAGDVAFIRFVEDVSVVTVTGKWTAHSTFRDDITVAGDRYDLADEVTLVVNDCDEVFDTIAEAFAELKDEVVTITFDDDGDVVEINATIDTYEDVFLVDVNMYDDEEDFGYIVVTVNPTVELEIDDSTVILLNGEEVTLEELEEAFEDFQDTWEDAKPIVTVRTEGNSDEDGAYATYVSVLTDSIIEGEITSIGADFVRVDGVRYDFKDLAFVVGNDYTLLLDSTDTIRAILDVVVTEDAFFAKVVEYGEDDLLVELADGTEVALEDVVGFELAMLGMVVLVEVNEDIVVSEPVSFHTGEFATSTSTYIRVDGQNFVLDEDVFYYNEVTEKFIGRTDLKAGDIVELFDIEDEIVGYVRLLEEEVEPPVDPDPDPTATGMIQVGALGFNDVYVYEVEDVAGATHFSVVASTALREIDGEVPVTFMGTGETTLQITDSDGTVLATGTLTIPDAFGQHAFEIDLELE